MKKLLLSIVAALTAGCAIAAESTIALPDPALKDDVSLKKSLENRHTTRQFSNRAIPPQELSNLLWAANGSNRKDGKRTVPAAMGRYAITLYVALPDGLYFYNRDSNHLELKAEGDFRGTSDGRKMGAQAGAVIIMVAKGVNAKNDLRWVGYIGVEAGAITQNIYLYCAAAGFNTVVCGSFDQRKLHEVLQLPVEQDVFLTQVVGYPAE